GGHRGGHVRAPGGPSVPALHRAGGAGGGDADPDQARPVAHHSPRRSMNDSRQPTADSRQPKGSGSDFGCRMSDLLFLIGYRGTGKSTVAGMLAEQLGWQVVDVD